MGAEIYTFSEAVAVSAIPVILSDSSDAVGITSIPTSLGISTQALAVADRIVSGFLTEQIDISEIVQKNIKYRINGMVRTKFVIRNKRK